MNDELADLARLGDLWRAAIDPNEPRIADARVTAIPVDECGEELLDAAEWMPVRPMSGQRAELGPAGTLVRSGVRDRLAEAARLLDDIEVAVVEGVRPESRQLAEFEAERARLSDAHPLWSAARLAAEAHRFVAPADSSAPHLSGGAVDICVLGLDGAELDMGTLVNGFQGRGGAACYTGCPDLPVDVRRRRARVVSAMTAAGFVNYPTEWWHWSYGDKWWAWTTGSTTAPYGPGQWRPDALTPSHRDARPRHHGSNS